MIKKSKYVFYVLGILLATVLGVIGFRTATFPSKQPRVAQKVTYKFLIKHHECKKEIIP